MRGWEAIKQEIDVAKIRGKSFYCNRHDKNNLVNPANGERIKDEKGNEIKPL